MEVLQADNATGQDMTPQQQTVQQLQSQAIEINPTLEAILDDKQNERDVIIMRLRALDAFLIKYGRLKHETLPRRVR